MMRKMILLVVVLSLAGCASIPTSGSVHSEPRRSADLSPGGITIVPEPPPQGASPTMIIRGFLTAMASFGSDYATAREYLTASASDSWSPHQADVLIYASGTTPQVSGNRVTMSGAIIGHLRPDGSFVGADAPTWTHDFGLVRENGEWRISHPPEGLALSYYMFTQSFSRIDTYFFPVTGTVLVPDPRYVQRGAWDRTTAARLVVNGPSTWLSAIMDSDIRGHIYLAGEVTLTNYIADIPLSEGALDLSVDQATNLAIEVAASMKDLPGVSRIRFLYGEEVIPISNAASDGSVSVSLANRYTPQATSQPKDLHVVSEGTISFLDATSLSPVPGEWGSRNRAISSFAVASNTPEIAAVVGNQLQVGSFDQTPSVALNADGLLRPQYDIQGNLWVVSSWQGSAQLTMISPAGKVSVDSSALAGMKIRGFQLSPEGRRMVFIRQTNSPGEPERHELGIALISSTDSGPSSIVSWKPIRLTWQGSALTTIMDVAWMGPSSLLVVGSHSGNQTGLFYTDIDGLGIDEWGLPQSWTPSQMAATTTEQGPQIMILDTDQQVWAYQDGYRWNHPIDVSVSTLAFPT
ncbi:MAG: LpqB family beta-propeller domain-containing protein [Propionibacteriaceae bacterium]|nr:LpqB family beta-propeller domain-containing protein [Propionibacteriaceae bacterium]